MKKAFLLYMFILGVLFVVVFPLATCFASYQENKENIDPNIVRSVSAFCRDHRKTLQESLDRGDGSGVNSVAQQLSHLQASDAEWKAVAQEMQVYRYPSQPSWKSVVCASMLYPQETDDHYKKVCNIDNIDEQARSKSQAHLLSLVYSAQHGHTLALYYLWRIFGEIYIIEYSCTPDVIDHFEGPLRQQLLSCDNIPEVCTVIVKEHHGFCKMATLWSVNRGQREVYTRRCEEMRGANHLQAKEFYVFDPQLERPLAAIKLELEKFQGKIHSDEFRSILSKLS